MNRSLVAGVALLVLLAGCPLPQPLAEYSTGTVTPPRILMDDQMTNRDTVIQVPAGCDTGPSWSLAAQLVDNDTSESITARWFVDYDRHNSSRCAPAVPQSVITATGDNDTQRSVPAFYFAPYDHAPTVGVTSSPDAVGVVHVVELVVSNQFQASADDTSRCTADGTGWPWRTPDVEGSVSFETQTYRWVFVNVPQSDTVACP